MLANPRAIDVIDVLSDLFIMRETPGHIRSDNGSEFIAKAVQEWVTAIGGKTAYIQPGSPWENGYVESFDARLRDELLDGGICTPCARPRLPSIVRHDQAARLTRIQAASIGGVHACLRRVAGCATPIGSAGLAGAAANAKLTFGPLSGADQHSDILHAVSSSQLTEARDRVQSFWGYNTAQWSIWTKIRFRYIYTAHEAKNRVGHAV
jgi:transposase InsO family protein